MLEDWGSSKSNEGSRWLYISFGEMQVKELVALPQRSYFISCLLFCFIAEQAAVVQLQKSDVWVE